MIKFRVPNTSLVAEAEKLSEPEFTDHDILISVFLHT